MQIFPERKIIGRPHIAAKRDTTLWVRMSEGEMAQVDAFGASWGSLTRSEAVRVLLHQALEGDAARAATEADYAALQRVYRLPAHDKGVSEQ